MKEDKCCHSQLFLHESKDRRSWRGGHCLVFIGVSNYIKHPPKALAMTSLIPFVTLIASVIAENITIL